MEDARTVKNLSYVYGLVRSRRTPRVKEKALPGMGAPRVVDAGDGLWLAVSDAPAKAYGAEAIEHGLRDMSWVSACAAAHEAVVEELARAQATVPMKLFTLFTSDTRAIAHIAKIRRRLERVLDRVDGCEEWGLRVYFDERRAMGEARESARREARRLSSGAGFLLLKKLQQEAQEGAVAEAREDAESLFDTLGRRAKDARQRTPMQPHAPLPGQEAGPGARLLLDAFFLVRRAKVAGFRAAAKKTAARIERPGLEVRLSGPWPPYNFVGSAS
jgi:hypothetical protein